MPRRLLPIVLILGFALTASSAYSFEIIVKPQETRSSPATSDPSLSENRQLEEVPADKSGQLLALFLRQNAGFREHVFGLVTDVYEDRASNPGVRLDRVLVGSRGTLVELTGLPRMGNPYSAIINKQTLRLIQKTGVAELIGAEGVSEIKDRRGGSALLLKPGETLYLWFGPIDDIEAFSIEHRLPDGESFAYFIDLDPRFLDRYHRDYEQATTPEKRYQFLIDYVAKDSEKKIWEVFAKLMRDFRNLNSFEGYYQAYLIAQEQNDAIMAKKLANTDEHRAKLEHIAITTLTDKTRMFDFDLRLHNNRTNRSTSDGWLFFQEKHQATKPLTGQLTVKLHEGSPVKVYFGRYRVTLAGEVRLSRWQKRESTWNGNYDGADDQVFPIEASIEISAANAAVSKPVEFGDLLIAEFVRGRMGGYHAVWATGDPVVTLKIKSVDLLQ